MHKYPQYIAENNSMEFLSDDGGHSYNLCHFWSNFEIADMDFWRSEAYTKFFDYLESKGGFYYEVRFEILCDHLLFTTCSLYPYSDGATRPYTALRRPCLHGKIKCTSLMM